MPWVRFDDQFATNRKVTGLSDPAFRLYVSAIFWSARNLTDGFVPEEDLDDVAPRNVRRPDSFVPQLVKRSLWHQSGDHCESPDCPEIYPDGWTIHDYHAYQPTKAQVAADRAAAAERQRQARARRKEASQGESQRDSHSDSRESHAAPTRPDPELSKESSDAARLKFENAVRIPEPFPLSEDMKQWVRDNTPGIDAWKEHEKFIDHWLGAPDKTGRKKDWLATWRNWMRRAQEYAEETIARRGENKPRTLAAADERCGLHPRQLADHCTICDAEARGAA